MPEAAGIDLTDRPKLSLQGLTQLRGSIEALHVAL